MNTTTNTEICRTCIDYRECKSHERPKGNPLIYCTNKYLGVVQVRRPLEEGDELSIAAA